MKPSGEAFQALYHRIKCFLIVFEDLFLVILKSCCKKLNLLLTITVLATIMINKIISISIFSCIAVCNYSHAQELHKHFEVNEAQNTEKISLTVSTKAGNSYLKGVNVDKPVEIWGDSENDMAASTFKMDQAKHLKIVEANLTCKDHMGVNFTEALTRNIFTEASTTNDVWHLNLSQNIPFDLNLNYLIGSAKIDLSRLSVENLKINSGSADVHVNYADGRMNSVAMDTFFVKVNLGKIIIDNLGLAMADDIIAEVGFGSIALDCGNNWKLNSKVTASVGAGSMTILLPPSDKPVLVKINNSALCRIDFTKDFKKIGENSYANSAYRENEKDFLQFSLDVGMGSISFIDRPVE
jgi:hypothetical protein